MIIFLKFFLDSDNRAPLYPGEKDNSRRDKSPVGSPERSKNTRNQNGIIDKPMMLQRHKSTLTQKTRNFNRRRNTVITEETMEYDQVSQSIGNSVNYSKDPNVNSVSKSVGQFEHSSLSSFLPPVGKSSMQLGSAGNSDSCRSSSLFFEDSNPNNNIQSFKSLNREMEISKEHSNRARMQDNNVGTSTKYISNTSSNSRSKAGLR